MKTPGLSSLVGQEDLETTIPIASPHSAELYYRPEGKAADKNCDKDFLCDEEDEDDESDALKKSFNLNFIFDLFRAAMDGKIGDKNGKKGPRESDYVMLVLNQNQKEDEDIAILIDRLRQNGVNCIFFTRNDIRNGTIKPPEISDVNKAKKVAIRNSQPSLLELDPISSPEINTSVPHFNGISPNEIRTLSIPPDPKPDTRSLASNANPLPRVPNSPFSPLPPLLSPQVDLSHSHNNNENESMLTTSYSQDDETPDLLSTPVKEPGVRKKRRRKRRYPYLARKPAKKKNIWKDLPATTNPKQTDENERDIAHADSASSSAFSDPYAFIPDEVVEPVIERPYTPKKSRLNGFSKHCSDSVEKEKVNVEISNVTPVQVGSVELSSPKIVIYDPRAFSPDIATEISGSRRRPVASKSKSRTSKSKSRKSKSKKSKVQTKSKICVQSISDVNGVNRVDELSLTDVSTPVNSTCASTTDDVKVEVFEISDIAISSNSQVDTKIEAVTDATALKETQFQESHTVNVITDSTNSAQEHQGDAAIKKESDQSEVVFQVPSHNLQKDAEPGPSMSEQSFMDAMQLRRPSFYSQIAGNVRNNMENHLDGRIIEVKQPKRRKRARNGFLLNHGDNCPEDPEAPYQLHLATQIILKLNKRRSKFKPKEDKGKSLLSYLKLVPKRSSRAGKSLANVQAADESVNNAPEASTSVFSGEWTQDRMYICNICGHIEDYFWNMVTHKGEIHPGIVVTHVELPDLPPVGFRVPPKDPATASLPPPPPCTKCSATYSNYPDLHRHIFECAGNAAWLEEKKPPRKKAKKKRGFKRRLSNTPRKVNPKKTDTPKRRNSEVFKCEFCTKEFKTEGWLKNHLVTHSLLISIPLDKLTLPPRAFNSSRRSCVQNLIAKA